MFAARWCWLGVWLHCGGRVLVCSFLCSFFLPFWNLLGFFSLTSIAYRRVIRVYQYEVGDDLSGRFFLLFSYLTLVFKCTLLIPRLAFLPTNFHGLEMLGGLFPCWLFPQLVPSFLLRVLGVCFISLDMRWIWALTLWWETPRCLVRFHCYRVIQHLKSLSQEAQKHVG